MLTCKDINEMAGDYLSGDLTVMKRISFKLHLMVCKHCNRYVSQLKIALASLKRMSGHSDSGELCSEEEVNKTLQFIRDNREK